MQYRDEKYQIKLGEIEMAETAVKTHVYWKHMKAFLDEQQFTLNFVMRTE